MTNLWWRAFVALSLSGGAFCVALVFAFALQKVIGRRVVAARAWVVAGRWAIGVALFSVSVPRGVALRSLAPQQAMASAALAKVNQQIASIGTSAAKVEKVGASRVPLAKGICFAAIAGAFLQLGFSLAALVRRQKTWRIVHRFRRASVRIDDNAIAPFAYRVSRAAEVVMPRALASRAALLRHEFAHHRHGDTAWALPLALVRALFILNPIVHAWLWCLRQLEEIAADEAAARGASLVYAKTLLAAGWQSIGVPARVHAAQTSLERRIRFMRLPKSHRFIQMGVFSFLVIVIAGGVAVAGLSAPLSRPLSRQEVMDAVGAEVDAGAVAALNRIRGDEHRRRFVQDGIARLADAQLSPLFQRKLAEYRLPSATLAVAVAESGVENLPQRTDEKALANAWVSAGIWQFIPETARNFGLTIDATHDERLDIESETDAAMRLISSLQLRFKDYRLALMAYNQGEDRVQEAIDATGSRDPAVLISQGGLNHYLNDVEAVELAMSAPELLAP